MRTRTITICALMVALLISVQFCLSFVSGVELVTVLFVSFCYVFGVKRGMIVATVFSVVRCIIFGFFINVITLYLIYYNLVAIVFGLLSKHKTAFKKATPLILLCTAILCAYFVITGIPISILYQEKVSILLWVLFGVCILLLTIYMIASFVSQNEIIKEISIVISIAVSCTILFTLLDDIITPLFYGYSFEVAVGYFYTSFLALLPQTISVSISVSILFYPLIKVMRSHINSNRNHIAK